MGIQVVYLDSEDDVVSIKDRFEFAKERQVLLVMPSEGEPLGQYLDLVILRRHADALRLEVGLVTVDGRLKGQAKAIGLPTFSTVESGLNKQRSWWRRRGRSERVRVRSHLDEGDRQEVQRRKKPRPDWQRWSLRYLAVLLHFFTLAVIFVAAAYAIPGATVTFKPEVKPIEVVKQIVADPQLETVNVGGASVPGRVMVAVQEWQADVETTGLVDTPDAPARGNVIFVNRLDQPVSVPTGTRVSSSAGTRVVFQTLSPVEVPGAVGATVETDVVAIEPGQEGNVDANLINRIEGALAAQLQVRNLEPMTGGGSRIERAVTEADLERLRSQILQQLQIRGLAEMEGQLAPQEFLARDSLRVSRILHETFSHFPGERTDRLTVDIRAELRATAVSETEAIGLVYEELAASVDPGYELVPESLRFESGRVTAVDDEGRVTFDMIGEGTVAARLPLDDFLVQISGRETSEAQTFLFEQLPLQDYPSIQVWPDWFGRIPYMPVRIQTKIETG